MTAGISDRRGGSAVTLPLRRRFSGLGSRWRSLFTIHIREASFAARGFAPSDVVMRRRLELVGEIFLAGFNRALVEDDGAALAASVARIDPAHRGFAVEGAAMGSAIADALMLGGGRLRAWMARNDADYTYLAHVGAGWALGRVPWRRSAILKHRDPVHGWLVFDGLGFHDTYFHTSWILRGRRRERRGYAGRVYDQGIGRALWFVAGGNIASTMDALRRFDADRHPDLWSGLGLALAYAGGASPHDLRRATVAAGPFRANLAQGAAFGAEAHARARYIPPHTREAVSLLTGRDAEAAVRLVRGSCAALPVAEAPAAPHYEAWRRDVRQMLLDP